MEDEVERLRRLLHSEDVWEEPSASMPFASNRYALGKNPAIESDSDGYEKIMSYEHRVGEASRVVDFPQYSLQIGQEAPEGEYFCTLRDLVKYPYTYIAAASRDVVVKDFFANGNVFERPWDFFYIHPPASVGRKGIVLVSSRQLKHFISTINNTLGTQFKLPESATETGFLIDFPKDGTPRPRYLGYTDEREMAEGLKQAIPSSSYRPDNEEYVDHKPTEKSLDAFKKKIEHLLEIDKQKKAASKEKKKNERFAKQRANRHLIKRVQRYLGIRKPGQNYLPAVKISRYSKSNQEVQIAATRLTALDVLDVDKAPPFNPEDSVVFICVDIESFERNHDLITEIGIATLDTADITATSPGNGGANWMKAIRGRHFRIQEYGHLRNKDFLMGCPEHFQFGESEWISNKDTVSEISKCFEPPYSKQDMPSKLEQSEPLDVTGKEAKRNLIFVGHDVVTDISYLKKLGYDPYSLANLQETVDTSFMYRAFQREPNTKNLGGILANLDLTGWYLHNAGNDAVYTLQAMIGIAIKAKLERPDKGSRAEESKARIADSVRQAVDSAWDAQQGWSSEGSDGGFPEKPPGQAASGGKTFEQSFKQNMPWRSTAGTTAPSSKRGDDRLPGKGRHTQGDGSKNF